jgi:putative ABC transport system permease protein
MLMLGAFAVLAMSLAVVGIYGVISYSTTERTREIGIRMALGAAPSDVLKLVVREGLVLTLAGIGLGLAAGLGLTRLMAGLLYAVSPADPVTFGVVSVVLVAVAVLANLVPARRAASLAPMLALRNE